MFHKFSFFFKDFFKSRTLMLSAVTQKNGVILDLFLYFAMVHNLFISFAQPDGTTTSSNSTDCIPLYLHKCYMYTDGYASDKTAISIKL